MTTTTHRTGDDAGTEQASARWRTVDIVVASALGVAFGVVFWAWNNLWNGLEAAFAGFPPGRAFLYGMWMVPAVLGPLVIRKRGAAVYVELVASIVSALLGSPWGLYVVAYGLIQGAAGELVFALSLYRSWRLPTAVLAGAAAGAAAALMDLAFYYPDWSGGWQLTYGVLVVVSAAVVAGLGSWLLVRALARTGVLSPFASGADQARV
jgi:energy-coupling factor transport system substrate-specific component